MKNITKEKITESFDNQTGEVSVESTVTVLKVPKEPPYVKLYLQDIIRLKDLPKGSDKILYMLLQSMGYNNIIAAYAPIKRIMCNQLDIKMNTLNKHIDNLYKAGVLIRIERGIYMADPELFGKGKWEDVRHIRMVIDYTPSGKREITAAVREVNGMKEALISNGEDRNLKIKSALKQTTIFDAIESNEAENQ